MLFTPRNNTSARVGGAVYYDSCVATDSPVENIECIRCMLSFRSKDRRLIENVIACTSGEQCFSLSQTVSQFPTIFPMNRPRRIHTLPRLFAF